MIFKVGDKVKFTRGIWVNGLLAYSGTIVQIDSRISTIPLLVHTAVGHRWLDLDSVEFIPNEEDISTMQEWLNEV